MRRFTIFIAIVSTAFLIQSCHKNRGWIKYSSNEDGFTVYLPAQPVKSVKQELTSFGKQSVHYVTWKPGTLDINKLKMLQVTYTDCPRRASADSVSLNATLDSSINLAKKTFTDLDVSSERVTVEGYPGRAIIVQDDRDNTTTIVKEILANNRLYAITAVAKKNYPTNDELNTFFDSFLVLR